MKRVKKESEQNLGFREATQAMFANIIRPLIENLKTKENVKTWDELDSNIEKIKLEIYTDLS